MKHPEVSVVVATRNRPEALAETLAALLTAVAARSAEILVVDDGGTPALCLPSHDQVRLTRTSGVERSLARNHGAREARGHVLIFVDDDITVSADFTSHHVTAMEEFGNVIGVGKISLPPGMLDSPFGRFRRSIEDPSQERTRGPVAEPNFCTAANMSIRRSTFMALGGFDPAILSGEDQDLALRFSRAGGGIVFLPEADVIHRDSVNEISSYGRRHEWGAEAMAPFLRRYPDRPENRTRARAAEPFRLAQSPGETLGRFCRMVLSRDWPLGLLRWITPKMERLHVSDRLLFSLYRIHLGLHLFRGFRAGLRRVVDAPPLPAPLHAGVRESGND